MNSSKIKVEVGARSETGFVRNENQDRMSGAEVPLGQLFIVADGMGGHKGGALAAELTIVGLQRHIAAASPDVAVEEIIRTAFKEVNANVHQKAHSDNPETEGMGSTAVLLLISNDIARLAHVGDSRAYLYRKKQLTQLTKDHTVVQKMVDAGMLTPEEAAKHPNASVLERAVGSKPGVEVEISPEMKIYNGDAILLCSDGLSGYASDPEIAAILRSPATVQEVPERLVELALKKGGEDNVTVQFIQCGTRQEALAGAERTKKLPVMKPPKSGSSLPKTAVVLLLFGAICGALFFYFKNKLVDTEVQMAAVQKISQGTGQKLREQLRTSAIQIEKLRLELADLKENSESSTSKLTAELKKAKISKNNATSQANKLKKNLNTTTAAKDKAEKLVKELEQKLSAANATIKEIQKNSENLQTQLDVAKQEIIGLKAKQTQDPDAGENE